MRKLSIYILALCLLAAGCQLAKPAGQPMGDPVGIWLEPHKQGDVLPPGYAPSIYFSNPASPDDPDTPAPYAESAGLGVVMREEGIGEDGQPYTIFGTRVSPQFLDRGYGSHTNIENDGALTTLRESFTGTLYIDRNAGAGAEELWVWYIYEDESGGLYAGQEIIDHIYPRMYDLDEGSSFTSKFSYKTTGLTAEAKEVSYSLIIKSIGRLERVQILELDADFDRLSTVSLEIQEGDEYQARPDAAYVAVRETYVTAGQEHQEHAIYARADAIDYDGKMALYHACKYMGPGGIVLPRSLKIIF